MFARNVRRVAHRKYKRGRLSQERFQEILKVLDDPAATKRWEDAVVTQVGAPDWNGILEWIKAHWIDILRVFLALLPLLIVLEPAPGDQDLEEFSDIDE